MQDIDQLQLSLLHLAVAANLLDSIGASAASAKAESAIESLRSDANLQKTWAQVCAADWARLDNAIDSLTHNSSFLKIVP